MCKKDSVSGIVSHSSDVETEDIERADGVSVKWLIGEKSGADFYMRKFTMAPDGSMVLHKHGNIYHMQYVLKGKIRVNVGREEYEVEEGSFLLIPKDTPHSYKNIGSGKAKFLCMIPAVEETDIDILE